MKRLVKFMCLMMAMLVAMFQPLQITHGADGCCATCQMKKEDEDAIELVEDKGEIS
jgi:hypothetical protein